MNSYNTMNSGLNIRVVPLNSSPRPNSSEHCKMRWWKIKHGKIKRVNKKRYIESKMTPRKRNMLYMHEPTKQHVGRGNGMAPDFEGYYIPTISISV